MSNNPHKTYQTKRQFMIAHICKEVKTGDTFETWPEHITLHPWFETTEPDALSRFMTANAILCEYPIDFTQHHLGEVAMFGPEGDIKVRTIGEDTSLGYIHGVLAGIFYGLGVDPTYIAGAYKPHMSEVAGVDYDNPKKIIVVDSMCLVAKDEKIKQIIGAEKFRRGQ